MRTGALGPLLGAALIGAPAFAETARPLLGLRVDGCPETPATLVQSMVAVELRRTVALFGETPATPPDGAASASTEVRVTCDGLRAEIQIDDRLTGKTVERVVDLGATAPLAR